MNRKIRHRAEYLGYRVALGCIGRLPLAAVRWIGRSIGLLYYLLGKRHRRRALHNLDRTLPGASSGHRAVARECFRSYGSIFFETAHAYARDPEEFQDRFDVDGWEHLEAARAAGRGFFLVTGHYGSWELALWPLGRRLGKIHVVARPLANARVDRDAQTQRARLGHAMLPVRAAGLRMRNILRNRGCVAIVIDQRVKPRNGILIPFLDRPAWMTPMVAALAIHAGAPVVPVFCVPQGRSRYKLTLLPPIFPEGRGMDAEVAMTRRYLEPLEQRIHERPELWLWMHRLWRLTQREVLPDHLAINRRLSGIAPEEPAVGLDDDRVPTDLRDGLRELLGSTFLDEARNAVVVANRDVGTLAARGVTEAFLVAGNRVRFAAALELARELDEARESADLPRRYRELDVCDLLVLDGLGAAQLRSDCMRELVALFEQRHGRRSVLVTTDVGTEDWPASLDGAAVPSVRRSLIDGAIVIRAPSSA